MLAMPSTHEKPLIAGFFIAVVARAEDGPTLPPAA